MPPMSFTGVVTKVGFMNRTATVTVSRWMTHRTTGKRMERSKKYLTHDQNNELRDGDVVIIRNCPPVSARKRFTLERIMKSPLRELEERRAHEKLAGTPGIAQLNATTSSSATQSLRT